MEEYYLRHVYLFMEKSRPRRGYRLVASGIYESDLFTIHLRPTLKINKQPSFEKIVHDLY